jgi:predicted Zn finger-like uncharacterized protein
MLIVCPSCASEYTIDPENLGADGRTLRCAICRDTWFVTPGGDPGATPVPDSRAALQGADFAPNAAPSTSARKPAVAIRALAAAAVALAALMFVAGPARLPLTFAWTKGRIGPVLASIAAPRIPLEFRGVIAEVATPDDGPADAAALLVSGEIANLADHDVSIPHLEILVRNGEEQVLTRWTSAPPRTDLGPGETVRFEMRLASPPPDGRQVRVHFTTVDRIASRGPAA